MIKGHGYGFKHFGWLMTNSEHIKTQFFYSRLELEDQRSNICLRKSDWLVIIHPLEKKTRLLPAAVFKADGEAIALWRLQLFHFKSCSFYYFCDGFSEVVKVVQEATAQVKPRKYDPKKLLTSLDMRKQFNQKVFFT